MPLTAAIAPTDTYRGRLAAAERHLRDSARQIDGAVGALAEAIAINPAATPLAQSLIWAVQRHRGQAGQYFSANFQDRFLDETLFANKRGGVFVDVGAYDGVTGSNSLFFEKFRGWTGLCIEPDADRFAELRALRDCRCEQVCVAASAGQAEFFRVREGFTQMGGLLATLNPDTADYLTEQSATDLITLPTTRLDDILAAHNLFDIDYLSIDIEGAELSVLQTLDFNRFRITALSVERNRNEAALRALLRGAGFCRVRQLAGDDIFIRADSIAAQAPHLIGDMLEEAMDHYARGDLPQAEAAYRDILAAEPDNPGIVYNFAITLAGQGRRAEAREALARALGLKPDFGLAQCLMDQID